jgi:hypothetical protein
VKASEESKARMSAGQMKRRKRESKKFNLSLQFVVESPGKRIARRHFVANFFPLRIVVLRNTPSLYTSLRGAESKL